MSFSLQKRSCKEYLLFLTWLELWWNKGGAVGDWDHITMGKAKIFLHCVMFSKMQRKSNDGYTMWTVLLSWWAILRLPSRAANLEKDFQLD